MRIDIMIIILGYTVVFFIVLCIISRLWFKEFSKNKWIIIFLISSSMMLGWIASSLHIYALSEPEFPPIPAGMMRRNEMLYRNDSLMKRMKELDSIHNGMVPDSAEFEVPCLIDTLDDDRFE